MYIDRGVGGRENNGVALKEKDSNDESPVDGSRPLSTCQEDRSNKNNSKVK